MNKGIWSVHRSISLFRIYKVKTVDKMKYSAKKVVNREKVLYTDNKYKYTQRMVFCYNTPMRLFDCCLENQQEMKIG